MEAHQRVEVTGVLAGGAELVGNAELGSDAQRAGWGWHGQLWHIGRVGGARRSPVCSPTTRNSVALRAGRES